MSLLLRLVFGQAARHGGNEIMSITISLGGKCCTVRALHDTGCTLRDPVTGGPVLVLERRALDPLWTPPVRDILAQPLPPEEKMARLHGEGSGRRFTLLPFTAVGTASGLLLAVYSDYIELAGRAAPPRAARAFGRPAQRRRRVSGPVGRRGGEKP